MRVLLAARGAACSLQRCSSSSPLVPWRLLTGSCLHEAPRSVVMAAAAGQRTRDGGAGGGGGGARSSSGSGVRGGGGGGRSFSGGGGSSNSSSGGSRGQQRRDSYGRTDNGRGGGRDSYGGQQQQRTAGPGERGRRPRAAAPSPAAAAAPRAAPPLPRPPPVDGDSSSFMDSSSSSSAAGGGYGADDGATADGVPQATFIERDPRIKDGPWSPLDAALVKAAQADAENATAPAPAPAAVRGGSGASSASAAAATGAEGAVLLGRSAAELKELAAALGHPAFRGQQIHDLLLKAARDPASRGAKSVADMHTLPAALRAQLAALGATTGRSAVHHTVASPCGTRKWLLQLAEGRLIETVGIPSDGGGSGGGAPRLTVCVSSQVGCPMRCSFCATGRGGFARNLRPHEILDQVLTVQEEFGRRVTNVGELFWWRAWEGVIAALFGGGAADCVSCCARRPPPALVPTC